MENKVFWDKTVCGEIIAGIEKDGYKWYFNSRYDDNAVAEGWVNQIETEGRHDIFILFGAANGIYAKKLREKYKENAIIIYEPSKEICEELLKDEDNFFEKEDIILENDEMNFNLIINSTLNYINYKYVHYIILPNYDKVYSLESVKVKHMLAKNVENIMFNRNTTIVFEESALKNCLYNIKDSLYQNTLADLITCMKEYTDRPAVIVAAGPSLDKNINELKKAKNKAFIIAVDSAVKVMAAAGILPDIIVTIDPQKSIARFKLPEIQNIPMVCDIYFNRHIYEVYSGRRFYTFINRGAAMQLIEDDEKNMLLSGGSVANTAFSLAEEMGFKDIVLIGQDLSYPEGKKHAQAANVHGKNEINNNKRRYYEIDGYNGGKVITEANLDIYRKWFEDIIRMHPTIKVYNATEGGAMIKGAENIPLSRYIEEHCMNVEEIDFNKIINELPKHFSEEKRQEKIEELCNIRTTGLSEFREAVRECRKNYEEFNKLNIQRKYTGGRFKTVVEKIIKLQDEIKDMLIMGFIEKYNAIKMYILEETVLDEKDTPYEENKSLYEHGIKMMDIYDENADMFEKDLDEIVKDWIN